MLGNALFQIIRQISTSGQLYNNSNTLKHFCGMNSSCHYSVNSSKTKMLQGEGFSFDDYDIIGFDLDNTLLRFNLKETIPLEYNCIAHFLVEERGYPRELLKPIEEDVDFIQRGLIFDVNRGNVLKIDRKGYILKASHGSTFLSDSEIYQTYGTHRCWDVTTMFAKDPLSTWNGPLSETMRTILDYFDLPASLIFARAVDAIDLKNKSKPEKYDVYSDILAAMIDMYQRENFAKGTSGYFEALKADPCRYIKKASPMVIEWLGKLRKQKATFLLTGSNIDFVNLTASTALGSNWQQLFDVVICFARKPGFFLENRPFYQVEKLKETSPIFGIDLKFDSIYTQGNWSELKQLLSTKFNSLSPRSLYVGDNMIQDIYTPSKHLNIDTVCIVEEILAENHEKAYEFTNLLKSKSWGSYFSVGNKITLWSSIIDQHVKMCFPKVDYFSRNPITHKYCTKYGKIYPNFSSPKKSY